MPVYFSIKTKLIVFPVFPVKKISRSRIFPNNIFVERSSTSRNFLTGEIIEKKTALKRIAFVFEDEIYEFEKIGKCLYQVSLERTNKQCLKVKRIYFMPRWENCSRCFWRRAVFSSEKMNSLHLLAFPSKIHW